MSQPPSSSPTPTPPPAEEPHNPLENHTPHKEADDSEEVFFEGCPMLRGELKRVFIAVLIAAVLIAAPFLIHHFAKSPWPWWVYAIFIVLGLIALMVPVIITKAVRYRITNYRIDFERGILGKRIDTLELWHVEDIQFRQTLMDRILGVGTITIISADDTTPTLPLHSLPHPRPLFEKIKQRVIAVKRQRGVVKMDIGGHTGDMTSA